MHHRDRGQHEESAVQRYVVAPHRAEDHEDRQRQNFAWETSGKTLDFLNLNRVDRNRHLLVTICTLVYQRVSFISYN